MEVKKKSEDLFAEAKKSAENYLQEAKNKSDDMVADARQKSEVLINESNRRAQEIMSKANQISDTKVSQSGKWAKDTAINTTTYVNNVVDQTEANLSRSLNDIRRLRAQIQQANQELQIELARPVSEPTDEQAHQAQSASKARRFKRND